MADAAATPQALVSSQAASRARVWRFVRRNPTLVIGLVVLGLMLLAALAAPWIAGDPYSMKPVQRFQPPSDAYWFGTDNSAGTSRAHRHGARVSRRRPCVALNRLDQSRIDVLPASSGRSRRSSCG
jgi:peptide/nickel transport system permease protein